MSKKELNRFENMRGIIDSTDDLEMMEACLGLIRDLIQINSLEQQKSQIEENLYKENKRRFYSFFVENLTPEEVSALGDKCSGRVRVLTEKREKEEAKKAKEENS
jgi:uncharacterized protein YerC